MLLILKALPPTVQGIYGKSKKEMPERMRLLHPDAADAFLKLDAHLNGIRCSDIFRSAEVSLAARRVKAGVQRPAFSGHNYGLCIDVDVDYCLRTFKLDKGELDDTLRAYGWYCHRKDMKRGFEDWHYNYFGVEAKVWLKACADKPTTEAALEKRIQSLYGDQFRLSVAEAQRALAKLGLYSGAVDGKLGPITEEALRVFQRAWMLLPASGKLEPVTQRTLAYVAADRQVVP